MKLLLQNKYVQLLGCLVAGGLLTYLFLPTKIETHEVEKIVNRDVIVHQVKTITKDGKITIITDTQDKSKEASTEKTLKQTTMNQKRLLVYGGINPIHQDKWLAGASYNVWGPVDIGYVYQDGNYITLGARF